MRKAIKRILRRIFIIILVVFAIYLLISNIDLIRDMASGDKISVMIDADPANTASDLLAIYRVLIDDDLYLRGLTAGQWRLADLDNDSTALSSLEYHEFLLESFQQNHIPHNPGSPLPLQYTRGTEPNMNDASFSIVKVSEEVPYAQKLNMICLGSLTNLAAALHQKPGLGAEIICYCLGPYYDPARRSWDKSDPVTRLDLEAMNILLNNDELELHLMPANVAKELYFTAPELWEFNTDGDSITDFIVSTLEADTVFAEGLALLEAFRNPDMCTQKQLIAPPENTQRKIYVYTRIDAVRMKREFMKSSAGRL